MKLSTGFLVSSLLVCYANATAEQGSTSLETRSSSFELSRQAVALIAVALSLASLGVVYDCHRRKRKKEQKDLAEQEQIKWFEKQQEQMKTPVKKSSVVNITCQSVPVATLRGKFSAPTRIPVLNLDLDSSRFSDMEFPEEIEESRLRRQVSQKVHISDMRRPHSERVVEASVVEFLPSSEVDLEMGDGKATVEYVTTSSA